MQQLQINKTSFKYLIILFLSCCCSTWQEIQAQPTGTRYLRFTRHNFLASNKINCIIQDKKEFIWLATSNGIQRFDGNRWIWLARRNESATALPDNNVYSLLEDKKDRFWVHTSAGLCLLNRNNFEFIPAVIKWSPEHSTRSIRSVMQLEDGRVWFTLSSGGLYYYDESAKQFNSGEKIIPVKDCQVYQLAYDKNKQQYYVGTDKGIMVYGVNKTIYHAGNNPNNNALLKSSTAGKRNVTLHLNNRGELWYSSASVHSCYDTKNDKIIFSDSVSKVWGLMGFTTDATGTTWGYGSTFAKMNLSSGKTELIPQTPGEPYGISFENGSCIMEDKEHTFWLGTNNGLFVYNRFCQQFFNYAIKDDADPSAKPFDVWGFIELKDSSIVVMTSSMQGLYFFDKDIKPLPQKFKIPTSGNLLNIRSGIRSRSNDLWLGGEKGYVFRVDPDKGKVERISDSAFAGLSIISIEEDRGGNIWFGSVNRIIVRRDALGGRYSRINTMPAGMKSSNVIYDLKAGDDEYIWAATSNTGLLKINIGNSVIEKKYLREPGNKNAMPAAVINAIVRISGNRLMLSTTEGIVLMDINKESFVLLNTSNHLPDNNISAMLADKENNVWFASDNGISKIQPEKKNVNSYGILEGLTNEIFNLGNPIQLKDGRMLFEHNEGFLLFDPAKFSNEKVPQNVSIIGLRLFDSNLNADSVLSSKNGLVLDYRQNYLTIEFSNMSFLNRYHIEYFYQLEGVDKDWVQVKGKPEAVYTYLPGGSYTFKVKCKTKGGISSMQITSFKIRIIPPVWKQWWFYGLIVLLATGLTFFFLRARYRRKIEAEKVRTRIARDLHDDMGSTLSTINILSEMAKKKIDVDIPATKKFIHQISDNSNRIMESMDDIVWNIDTGNEGIDNILSRMREFAGNLLEARGITYSFKEDGRMKQLNFDLGRRHDFFMIFKEAVNNLAKYSEATKAVIEISVRKNELQLVISDNGRGFDPALIKDGNGLINMQQRAGALKGRLDINSVAGNGTTITLHIPV